MAIMMDNPVELVQRFDPKAVGYERIDTRTFQQTLACNKGARFVTLTSLTVPDYRKTNCPFKNNILKLARVNGVVNFNYERAVNRQRTREGNEADFEALPRAWGTRLSGLPFVSHVTKSGDHRLYLELKAENVYGVEYFTLDGETIPTEEVKLFLTVKKPNDRQEVEKEIVLRDYDVDNIISIVIDGKGYVIA